MATIVDVLRHLVAHTPGLGAENRAEHADAVDHFGHQLVDAGAYDHDQVFPAAVAAAAGDAGKDAQIAQLQAQLAAAQPAQAQDPAAGS